MKEKWISRHLALAEFISNYSKDPSTKVGAVFVNPETNACISSGYNGFPRGIYDISERWYDRDTKLKYVVHAETNAIYNACLNGVSLKDSFLFLNVWLPCSECCKAIIQVGTKEIFCGLTKEQIPERWKESSRLSESMLSEAGIPFNYKNTTITR